MMAEAAREQPQPAVRPIPEGYHTVTPWIISRDTDQLIKFMTSAFGAEEIARMQDDQGVIGHAEVRVGDSIVMMFDSRQGWPDTPGFMRLYVEDADAAYAQALRAGATSITEVTKLFFGDRVGRVRDPLGNVWWIQTRVEDVSPERMGELAQERGAVEAMEYVQNSLDAYLKGSQRLDERGHTA
jgi:PhnB protein